jgi:septation ring formation regulator EzrA
MSDSGDWKEWSRHVLIELERLNTQQGEMSDTLQVNTLQLAEHMRRTALVEDQLEVLKADVLPIKNYIDTLRTSELQSREKADLYRRALMTVFAGALGIGLKELCVYLLKAF